MARHEVESVLHVDAVAGSTFPSECCPGFRGLGERVPVVRFDDLDEFLSKQRIDVGGDIHSVSECAAFAVAACLQLSAATACRTQCVSRAPEITAVRSF
jgi:hypothetical protein